MGKQPVSPSTSSHVIYKQQPPRKSFVIYGSPDFDNFEVSRAGRKEKSVTPLYTGLSQHHVSIYRNTNDIEDGHC